MKRNQKKDLCKKAVKRKEYIKSRRIIIVGVILFITVFLGVLLVGLIPKDLQWVALESPIFQIFEIYECAAFILSLGLIIGGYYYWQGYECYSIRENLTNETEEKE